MHKVDARACCAPLQRDRLEQLADKLGLPGTRDLIPNLVRMLTDPVRVPLILPEIPKGAAALLKDLVVADATGIVLPDKPILADPDFRPLYDLGLAHVGRDHLGTLRVVLPRETAAILWNHYRAEEASDLKAAPEEPLERLSAQADTFRRNAGTLVALVETEGIALTAKAEITKNEVTRKILPVLEPAGYAMDAENRYPLDLGHLLRYLLHFEILKAEAERLIVGTSADAFLDATETELVAAASAYAGLVGEADWPGWAIQALLALPDDAWVDAEKIAAALSPRRSPRKTQKELQERRLEMLQRLEVCGAIEAGWTAAGAWRIRAARAVLQPGPRPSAGAATTGTPASPIFVTADFKVAAPRQLAAPIRREISRFARLLRSDRMDQWEITRESVSRAADAGTDADSLIGFLAAHTATPLPQNVTDSIRLWQEHHRDVVYHHGPVLIVQNPTEQKWVRDLAAKDGSLAAEPLPGLFVLHPESTTDLLERIRTRRSISRVPGTRISRSTIKFSDIVATHRPQPPASAPGGVQMVPL